MNCPDKAHKESGEKRGYDPEEAYNFGLTIKQLVADRDLTGLFELVQSELMRGPRKRFIEGRTFDQVFSKDWRSTILASEVECSPVGWRGFTLADGLVWYKFDSPYYPGVWQIISINGAVEEEYTSAITDPAWRVEDKVIPPECFVREFASGDNFEVYADTYGIEDFGDFLKYTGKYFGREIDRLEPITAYRWTFHLATILGDCPTADPEIYVSSLATLSIDKDDVTRARCLDEDRCLEDSYRLLAPLSQAECQNLAPYLPGQCESAYLVETAEETGGTMGTIYHYNFYGLFNLADGRKAIVPLVNFHFENDARNFLDEFRIRH